jgi:hypothetical protein
MCQEDPYFQLLVSTDSIQDTYGYLLAVSDQDPLYVESLGRMGLLVRFLKAIFPSERLSIRAITSPLHCAVVI